MLPLVVTAASFHSSGELFFFLGLWTKLQIMQNAFFHFSRHQATTVDLSLLFKHRLFVYVAVPGLQAVLNMVGLMRPGLVSWLDTNKCALAKLRHNSELSEGLHTLGAAALV